MTGLSLGRPPKKLIRPCRAAICTRLLLRRAGRGGGDDHVGAAPVGELEDLRRPTSVSAEQIAASGLTRSAAMLEPLGG